MLAGLDAGARAEFAETGKRATKKETEVVVLVPLRVSFPEMPSEPVLTALKKRGLKWNNAAKAWDGTGDPADVQGEADLAAGIVQPLPLEPSG